MKKDLPEQHGDGHARHETGDRVAQQGIYTGDHQGADKQEGGGQVPAPANLPAGKPGEHAFDLRPCRQ